MARAWVGGEKPFPRGLLCLIKREPGPSAVIGFLVLLVIATVVLIGVTDHTWAEWWVNFWEG